MFSYIRRARAIAATVRRLESEVGELKQNVAKSQQTLKDIEQRCQVTLERARLENLAVSKTMEAESEKIGKAVAAMFEQIRLAKTEASRARDVGRRSGGGAS